MIDHPTQAFEAPPQAPYHCIDMFAGKAAISKAFRMAGCNAVALDLSFHEDGRDEAYLNY